jgi:glucans biosynthesis protein
MHRRDIFPVMAGLTIWATGTPSRTSFASAASFDSKVVRQLARDLARKAYKQPDRTLPDDLAKLDYSTFQTLRFNKSRALWHNDGSRFTVEFFHRGYIFKDRSISAKWWMAR